jgi:glycogen debranching enzyme
MSGARSTIGTGERVALVEGSAFGISSASGDMRAGHPEGLFFRDTRFLSQLELRLNGQRPESLAVHGGDPFSAVFVLRDHVPVVPDPTTSTLPDAHVVVQRSRYVGRGMREDLTVRNYGPEATFCLVELEVDADFAPVFDARDQRVDPVRSDAVRMSADHSRLSFRYQRGAHSRAVWVDFSEPPRFDGRIAVWEIIVPARGSWSVCLQVTPVIDGDPIEPRYRCGQPVDRAEPRARLEAWRRRLPTVEIGHETFQSLVQRAAVELASLRIVDPEYPERVVVAAGAPWFMALSGRDALLTSWMTMMFDPDLALGTLQTLARFQGREVNPVTEEQPGRILAQTRFGETAALSLAGGRFSYAAADATPLFVMVLGELARWGTRRADVDALLPSADRALGWISEHGDRDGDGYVEYQRTTDRGPAHQGWKQGPGAIAFASGELARGPIALCEVQAYVYGALVARAHCATEQGDAALGERLRKQATALKEAFNQDFWLPEQGCFALALDGDKRPVDAPASNMGHCLWTGIVDEDKAPMVVRTLLGPDLFSGWGVRTLAASVPGYNPVSAHTGGVWPHDNAILVAGLMRYGFLEEAHRLCAGLLAAGAHFGARMPELFAGFSRDELPFPVTYPTSCSPRAWAAASPLLLLRSLLRFEPDIRHARLHLAPALPDWVGRVRVGGIPLMDGTVAFEAVGATCRVTEAPGDLEIVSRPRQATV